MTEPGPGLTSGLRSGPAALSLTGLGVFPVKSTAGRPVDSAVVDRGGLAGDRRWMVLDGTGAMLTARTEPRLLTVTADVAATDPEVSGLRLRSSAVAGPAELQVAEPEGPERSVQVFHDETVGVDGGPQLRDWLRAALGRDDVTAVFARRPQARRLDPAHADRDDFTGYADGYPLLACTTSSLARLNELIVQEALERGEEPAEPLPMDRFRPNLVIDGDEPFAEDDWRRIRIGEVAFRVVKPCARCVLTTIDPVTLTRGKEPLRTLARHRKVGSKAMFGMNLIPDTLGPLRVGLPVDVLS